MTLEDSVTNLRGYAKNNKYYERYPERIDISRDET